jgi:hypothetical protein
LYYQILHALAVYTMTDYVILGAGARLSLWIAFKLPLERSGEILERLLAGVFWVALAALFAALIGFVVGPIPSWSAIIIVLLMMIYLKN